MRTLQKFLGTLNPESVVNTYAAITSPDFLELVEAAEEGMTIQELLDQRRNEAAAFLNDMKGMEVTSFGGKVFVAYQSVRRDNGYVSIAAELVSIDALDSKERIRVVERHEWCMDTWAKIASYGVAETELCKKEKEAFAADIIRRALLLGATEAARDLNIKRIGEELRKPNRESEAHHSEEEVRDHLANLLGVELYRKDAEELRLYYKVLEAKQIHDRHSLRFEVNEARLAVFPDLRGGDGS